MYNIPDIPISDLLYKLTGEEDIKFPVLPICNHEELRKFKQYYDIDHSTRHPYDKTAILTHLYNGG